MCALLPLRLHYPRSTICFQKIPQFSWPQYYSSPDCVQLSVEQYRAKLYDIIRYSIKSEHEGQKNLKALKIISQYVIGKLIRKTFTGLRRNEKQEKRQIRVIIHHTYLSFLSKLTQCSSLMCL